MNKSEIKTKIRPAKLSDAGEIINIYNYYIENTTISYEYDIVDETVMSVRMKNTIQDYPWIVMESEDMSDDTKVTQLKINGTTVPQLMSNDTLVPQGKIIGYAYASRYKERAAYQWNCELSVYINHDYIGKGAGSMLYDVLIKIITQMGFCNAYVLIDYPNPSSEALHMKYGFEKTGIYQDIGYKKSAWRSLLSMRLRISENPGVINRDWKGILFDMMA